MPLKESSLLSRKKMYDLFTSTQPSYKVVQEIHEFQINLSLPYISYIIPCH